MNIKYRFVFAGVIALTTLAFAADPKGPKEVDQVWMKAMKANDIDAAVACYASNAVAWFPGFPEAKGTDAIRATYHRFLDDKTVTDVELSDTNYKTIGQTGIGWGTFKMTLTPKAGGAPVTMTGRFTEVTEPRDGRWVYIVDHASADPPPSDANEKK